MLEAIQYGVCAALIGVAYAHIMPDEPTPLKWWFHLLAKIEEKSKFIAYPLGYCPMCCSGQIAFWYWMITHGFKWVYFYVGLGWTPWAMRLPSLEIADMPLALLSAAVAILCVHPLIMIHEWAKKLSKP